MHRLAPGLAVTAVILAFLWRTGAQSADDNKTYVFCTGGRIAISLFESYGRTNSFTWCQLFASADGEKARQFARRLGGEGASCSCG